MPTLTNVFLSHADADPGAYFIARDSRRQKFLPRHAGPKFGNRNQRRQHNGTDMKHALAVNIVQFKALNLGPIHQCRMRCRQPNVSSPNANVLGRIDLCQSLQQNFRPLHLRAIQGTAERI